MAWNEVQTRLTMWPLATTLNSPSTTLPSRLLTAPHLHRPLLFLECDQPPFTLGLWRLCAFCLLSLLTPSGITSDVSSLKETSNSLSKIAASPFYSLFFFLALADIILYIHLYSCSCSPHQGVTEILSSSGSPSSLSVIISISSCVCVAADGRIPFFLWPNNTPFKAQLCGY